MSSASRADDALLHLPPGNKGSGSTVNIVGGSFIDIAGDYHNHGVVVNNQRISDEGSRNFQILTHYT